MKNTIQTICLVGFTASMCAMQAMQTTLKNPVPKIEGITKQHKTPPDALLKNTIENIVDKLQEQEIKESILNSTYSIPKNLLMPLNWQPLYMQVLSEYEHIDDIDKFSFSFKYSSYAECIVAQAIKILKKQLASNDALVCSEGQSCSYFVVTASLLSHILSLGDASKFIPLAFSGKFFCDQCFTYGENKKCSISHEKNGFMLPSESALKSYAEYLNNIALPAPSSTYIVLDLVCSGSSLLSFIEVFKKAHIQLIQQEPTIETFIFRKSNLFGNPMEKQLRNMGSVFLDRDEYKKNCTIFDALSANYDDKNMRLVPEYKKEAWDTTNPFTFTPDKKAKEVCYAIVDYIKNNKLNLLKQIKDQALNPTMSTTSTF